MIWFPVQLIACFLLGAVIGYLAQRAGYAGIEGFNYFRGAARGCGCLLVVTLIAIIYPASHLTKSPAMLALLSSLGFLALIFGILKGLVFNPWRWLGQSEDVPEVAGPDGQPLIRGSQKGESDMPAGSPPPGLEGPASGKRRSGSKMDVVWPKLDELQDQPPPPPPPKRPRTPER